MGKSTNQIINEIYWEVNGGNVIKQNTKLLTEDFNEIKKMADMANASMDKVIKNYTTLANMPKHMSSVSPSIISKTEKRLATDIIRRTHATETHYATESDGAGVDYKAAREAYRWLQAEKRKQKKLEEEITKQKEEAAAIEKEITEEKKAALSSEKKARKMTENQVEKNERAKERNRTLQYRAETERKEYERKRKLDEENSNWRKYRNEHPERYGAGGQKYNWRIQGANGLANIGNRISSIGVGGRIIGDTMNMAAGLIKAPATGVIGIFTTLGKSITDLGKAATTAYTEIEYVRTRLGIVSSSQSQADTIFRDIAKFATHSPFDVKGTTETAILLKQSGVYASELLDTIRMIGDISGGNVEKLNSIATKYAQIVAFGKANLRDIRLFANAGIPIYDALAEELKVSNAEVKKMVTSGKITAEVIEKVFKNLTSAGGVFENATDVGARTLRARLQNLKDAKQLALSSMGEYIVNFGEQTGGDSTVKNAVSWAEKIYQYLYSSVNTKNIEKSVKVIENNRGRINELKNLKDSTDDKYLKKLIEEQIKLEEAKVDIDKERALYTASYDIKFDKYEESVTKLFEKYGELWNARDLYEKLNDIVNYKEGVGKYDDAELTDEQKEFFGNYLNIDTRLLQEEMKALNEYIYLRTKGLNLNEKEIKYKRESLLLEAQSAAADRTNKLNESSSSLGSRFQELGEIYRNSEEYKQKTEDDKKKLLTEALEQLKELNKKTIDEKGTIDFSKFSYSQLKENIENGAFSVIKELPVVKGQKASEEDADLLKSQFKTVIASITNQKLYNLSSDTKANIAKLATELNSFVGQAFVDNFEETKHAIEFEIDRSSLSNEQKAQIKTHLIWATNVYGTDISGLNANPNADGKEFIALWRRILGQGLGISPLAVRSTTGALDYYQNDIAVRNRAAGMLGAGIRSGELSISDLQKLMSSTTGAKTLKGDTSETWQIDWKNANKNLKDFANSLSASTSVINAYKDSVQTEYDTLVNLLTSGIFTAESNGNTNKYINAKKMAEYWTDQSELAVNAFGEKLVNAEGKEVYSFNKKGEALDKEGNVLANQELTITGKIYEELQKRLPELKKELNDITIRSYEAEGRDAIVNARWFESAKAQFGRYGASYEQMEYINSNQDYYQKLVEAEIEKRVTELGSALTKEDVKRLYLEGNEEASEIMQRAVFRAYLSNPFKGGAREFAELQQYNKYGQIYRGITSGEAEKDREEELKAISNKYRYGEVLRLAGFDNNLDFGKLAAGQGVDEIIVRQKVAEEAIKNLKKEAVSSLSEIAMNGLKDTFIAPFETLGESIVKIADGSWEAADAWDELSNKMRGITGSIIAQTGDLMKNAGLALIQAGAMEHNKAYIWGGIGLAAAGGIAAGLGSAIQNNKDDSKKNTDEQKKLQDLTDKIQELLKQARADALYYEKNLRHRTALGINEKFSYTSVNDAIITPRGEVIETSPDDYLFATKNPQSMGVVQPRINFTVIDNAGVNVETKQNVLPDGTIELQAILQSAMDQYIASERSDDAFAARQYRLNGSQAVM